MPRPTALFTSVLFQSSAGLLWFIRTTAVDRNPVHGWCRTRARAQTPKRGGHKNGHSESTQQNSVSRNHLRRLAPRAGLEPATLRLTECSRLSILLILRACSSGAIVLLPGVRKEIVH